MPQATIQPRISPEQMIGPPPPDTKYGLKPPTRDHRLCMRNPSFEPTTNLGTRIFQLVDEPGWRANHGELTDQSEHLCGTQNQTCIRMAVYEGMV